jgi:molecular chaperone Hsp33
VFDAADAHSALTALFSADDVRAFRPRYPKFACSCSRARVAAALRLLGSAEVESILTERGTVGVDCEFCNRRYEFNAAEAREIFSAPPAAIVH